MQILFRNNPARLAKPMIVRVLRSFQEFAQVEASGGIVLLLCAIIALLWANSPWGGSYVSLWSSKLTLAFGDLGFSTSLAHLINDGLMAVFFFVVGLEIKREVLAGELSSLRQATLPIAAAIGGMIVPALIFTALNFGGAGASGWGVPMATDIAFALGILAVLGSRVPLGLKVFLTALAIVDDIGAVLVIAVFYTSQISWTSLGIAALLLLLLVTANWLNVRSPMPYGILGIALWVAVLSSGIHATIAGVLLALTIPARARIDSSQFIAKSRALLDDMERSGEQATGLHIQEEQQSAIHGLERACEAVETPLQRAEHALHPWVAFLIMPLFALANAGVVIGGDFVGEVTSAVSLGVIFGLVLGKQIGVTLFTWLAVRAGIASLPAGVSWKQIYGAAWLAGIGFTMSLFIAELAFSDEHLLTSGKVGILTASTIAGLVGWAILSRLGAQSTAAAE